MNIPFHKYEGTGNDFILIDNRRQEFGLSSGQIARLCDRHFGIGADGLILLQLEPGFDFRMVYHNSDGIEGSMCGNGGRCAVLFARTLKLIGHSARLAAYDGEHTAVFTGPDAVRISMLPVSEITALQDGFVLNTGSPHFVTQVENTDIVDVLREGRKLRNDRRFEPDGVNVNFYSHRGADCSMRTYERGVEEETLSCGTGTVAVAIVRALQHAYPDGRHEVRVHSRGGPLSVFFTKKGNRFSDVFLEGEARFVFEGRFKL